MHLDDKQIEDINKAAIKLATLELYDYNNEYNFYNGIDCRLKLSEIAKTYLFGRALIEKLYEKDHEVQALIRTNKDNEDTVKYSNYKNGIYSD